jgi:thiol-disulfide isomerase/thioredoxin
MKRVVVLLALIALLGSCKRRETPVTTSGEPPQRRSQPQQTATGTEAGAMMPEYSAMWLDGSKFDLAKHRDKVVLLNLWATWCGPCREEIPELQKIHDHYTSRGFEVIGVSVDESGVEAVKQFVAEKEMKYPVALDAEGKLAAILQTSVLPTSILIDRSGRIVWRSVGLIQESDPGLKSAIEKAL